MKVGEMYRVVFINDDICRVSGNLTGGRNIKVGDRLILLDYWVDSFFPASSYSSVSWKFLVPTGEIGFVHASVLISNNKMMRKVKKLFDKLFELECSVNA